MEDLFEGWGWGEVTCPTGTPPLMAAVAKARHRQHVGFFAA